MELIDLAHLAIGSPTQVALPGVSQVEMRDLLEAPGCVEVVVGFLKQTVRCVEKCSCLRGRCERLPVVTCMKARLQLTNPIPAGGPDEGRTLLEMLLEAALVERVVAKRAELRCQSPYSPDEAELSHHNINDQGETRILRDVKSRLRFA